QDGAPPHYGLHVREYLNNIFPNRLIGRRGSIEWPPRSPDLSPLDYFGIPEGPLTYPRFPQRSHLPKLTSSHQLTLLLDTDSIFRYNSQNIAWDSFVLPEKSLKSTNFKPKLDRNVLLEPGFDNEVQPTPDITADYEGRGPGRGSRIVPRGGHCCVRGGGIVSGGEVLIVAARLASVQLEVRVCSAPAKMP
ncbi:hypothetical protein J6590_098624, partial [Homalodisca vitripennis]